MCELGTRIKGIIIKKKDLKVGIVTESEYILLGFNLALYAIKFITSLIKQGYYTVFDYICKIIYEYQTVNMYTTSNTYLIYYSIIMVMNFGFFKIKTIVLNNVNFLNIMFLTICLKQNVLKTPLGTNERMYTIHFLI